MVDEGGGWTIKLIGWLLVALGACVGMLTGLVALIWHSDQEKHRERKRDTEKLRSDFTDLELNCVSDATLTEVKQEWFRQLELTRVERKEMHEENKRAVAELRRSSDTFLQRIEAKIDENERRDSQTRHDIRDSVHAIALQVAALSARAKHEAEKRG